MKISVQMTRSLLAAGLALWAGTRTMAGTPDINGDVGFIRNEGQVKDQEGTFAKDVLYLAHVGGMQVQLRRTGFSYQVLCAAEVTDRTTLVEAKVEAGKAVSMERIDFDLALAQAGVPFTIEEGEELPGVFNYIGEEEIYGVKRFRSVKFVGAWTGADLLFEIVKRADGTPQFKYSLIAHEGTSIASLGMNVRGLSNSWVAGATMRMDGAHFGIEESIPESWLINSHGVKMPVQMAYATSDASAPKTLFTCADRALTVVPAGQQLVIDPTPNRVWGRYYGGTAVVGEEYARLAVKNSSPTTIALSGSTTSTGIASAGAHQFTFGGGFDFDGFVASFNSSGGLNWATYYGGNVDDRAYSVAIDASGNIYACGTTKTSTGTIIATVGSHQATYGGGTYDAYLVKFDAVGVRKWGTYYGGDAQDRAMSVTVDLSGNIYIGGETFSPNNIHTVGAHQTVRGALTFPGYWDLFLAKFNSAGVRQWGTYYGGTGLEFGACVTTDNDNNVYLGGGTDSPNGVNVIATAGTWQTTNTAGDVDGLVAKFTTGGTRLWGTFYGGSSTDVVRDISVDCGDGAWICGGTESANTGNIIATGGAHQTTYGTNGDGYMAKLSPVGTRVYGSYYGGSLYDVVNSVCAVGNNVVYFAGSTTSANTAANIIATPGSWQTSLAGNSDAFFTLFTPAGVRTWGTYYGGHDFDYGDGIEYFAYSKVVIVGNTNSTTGIASSGSLAPGGGFDWYIAQFDGATPVDCLIDMPLAPDPPMSELCELMDDGVIHDASTGTLLLNPTLCTACGVNVFDLSGRRVFTTQVNSDRITLPEDVRTKPFIVQVVTDKGTCSKVIVPDPAYAR